MILGLLCLLAGVMFVALILIDTKGDWWQRWDPYDNLPWDREQRKRWRKK